MIFKIGPTLIIAIIILSWALYERTSRNTLRRSTKIVIILSIISTSAYRFILTSWGSNSKYAVLGGLRIVAQVVSYEVCIALFVITLVLMIKTINLKEMRIMQTGGWAAVIILPLFLGWFLLCLAESNRTPFDLAEGESEIVSGFNIEYGGGIFALIFIREYGMVLFLSFLTRVLFMRNRFMIVKIIIIAVIFVWVRSSFPRVRYDKLIIISWKLITPYSIAMIVIRRTI